MEFRFYRLLWKVRTMKDGVQIFIGSVKSCYSHNIRSTGISFTLMLQLAQILNLLIVVNILERMRRMD